MTIEQLKVLITADVSGLTKEIKKATNSFNGLEASVVSSSRTINSAVGSITTSVKKLASLTALTYFGKKAIQMASDLEEVQNVVEVAFGSATAEINEFADQAMEAFGLTQYQAKKTASTIMAMSNGMGIGAKAGKTMAINLTKLSADMASFYNVSQDVAETALHSVFTGETETLKRFGIVMTEANLKAFALSQGITTLYNDMSQAQKVALRYNYVMTATAQAQGDFARTSMNWANQIRVLTGQWTTLVSTIGKGLIAVLTPVLGVLNRILASAIGIVNTFAKIFGGTGIASVGTTISDAGAGANDLSEGLDKSASSAKKLKKYLAGFDELNVISNNDGSGSGAGGLAGGGGGADFEVPDYYGEITETANMGKGFNEVLDLLNTNILKYYDSITAFGTTLGEKFNDAFKSIDWALLGETIGNGINLVYETANNFMEAVEWYELGSSFATGINSAFETIKWDEIGKNIANKVNAIGLTFAGLVDNIDFELIGTSLKTRFDSAINNVEWEKIGGAVGTALTGIGVALDNFLKDGTIENLGLKITDALNSAMANLDAEALGQSVGNLTKQIIQAFENIDWTLIASKFREFLDGLDIVGIFADWVGANIDNIGSLISGFFDLPEGLGDAIAGLVVPLTVLAGALLKIGSSVGVFALFQNLGLALSKLNPITTAISTAFGAFTSTLFGMPAGTFKATEAIGMLVEGLTKSGAEIEYAKGIIKALWTTLKAHPIALVVAGIVALIATIVKAYQTNEQFRAEIDKLWNEHLKPLWENIKDLVSGLLEILGGLISWFVGDFLDLWDKSFQTIWAVAQPVLTSVIDVLSAVTGALAGLINFVVGVFTGDWERAWEGVKAIFKNVFEGLIACAKAPINGIIGLINGMITAVTSGVNTVIRALNRIKVNIPSWVPVYGGKSFGINIQTLTAPKIPLLAKGGVITEPTVAMMGEYAGAYNNPEIVTPQNILKSTIEDSNKSVVDALIQQTKQLLVALEEVDMNVSIGDEVIAQSAKRGNQSYQKRTGKPLFV